MRVLETVLYAEDLVAARAFYVDFLGLEEILFDPDRDLFLRCDGSVLIIFKASKTVIADAIVPPHGTIGAGHMAFGASETELEEWTQKLGEKTIKTIDWPNGARSIYFEDPAGNILEFATPNLWKI